MQTERIRPKINSVEEVRTEPQKESAKKLCGGSSRQISKRIRPKILWRQFPLYLKKNDVEKVDTVTNVLYDQIGKYLNL